MTAAEQPPHADDRPDPADLVEVADFHTGSVEPQLLVARLEDAGIRAFTFGTATDVLGFLEASTTRHGGIQVQVQRSDEAEARRIYEAFMAERADDTGDGSTGDAAADLGIDAGGGDGDGGE